MEEKITVTNLDEEELRVLELVLGRYMNFRLGRFNEKGNERLLKECRARSNDESLDDTGATVFILKEIWKRLRETHRLRAVK